MPFVIHIPLTEDQGAIGAAFAADVAMLAEETGADKTQVGDLLNFAIAGALQDGVDLADEAQCWTVGATRHGSHWPGLVDDARRAIQALGPAAADYMNQTGAGNSPGVLEALAMWHRGHFTLTPEQAKARMGSEKDPVLRRLLAMLAARS